MLYFCHGSGQALFHGKNGTNHPQQSNITKWNHWSVTLTGNTFFRYRSFIPLLLLPLLLWVGHVRRRNIIITQTWFTHEGITFRRRWPLFYASLVFNSGHYGGFYACRYSGRNTVTQVADSLTRGIYSRWLAQPLGNAHELSIAVLTRWPHFVIVLFGSTMCLGTGWLKRIFWPINLTPTHTGASKCLHHSSLWQWQVGSLLSPGKKYCQRKEYYCLLPASFTGRLYSDRLQCAVAFCS